MLLGAALLLLLLLLMGNLAMRQRYVTALSSLALSLTHTHGGKVNVADSSKGVCEIFRGVLAMKHEQGKKKKTIAQQCPEIRVCDQA